MVDTIVALATAFGEASIHVLRLSGPDAKQIIESCFLPHHPARWAEDKSYTLHLGYFKDNEEHLDEVLVSRMHKPYSYTGEDVFEINCHGGPFLAQRLLEVCLKQGARLAEPGEFTKRAFLNGKLDLIQAESIIDLISSRTESGSRLAFSQLKGGLSEKILQVREQVMDILAFIEAGIDFPEDEVEDLDREQLRERLQGALGLVEEILAGSKTGKILREGLQTAIVGLPNVGKSSLLNALVREERAIVTDIPGTTRDEIREAVSVGGILLQLIDTAGIRESDDPVERLGIERSWRSIEKADLILLVVKANSALATEEVKIIQTQPEKVIVIANKVDLLKDPQDFTPGLGLGTWIPFSVHKHLGFEALDAEIKRRVYQGRMVSKDEPLLSNARQISALERCRSALVSALTGVESGMPWDILSIDVRQGLQAVSEMTGDQIQENLLETIFSRFCIGK
ncbi:tRNA uridine-5-carboxymethylaminomethyl(34) synthesis GTPase MnmE [Paradesulfitobacterium ferrireducens]|uniref:tRNA uridine-5-carboxymethylaminomethyl(34) synthesis GTPase MnmE n=1 Tax=Paradesulfitobacterium ferrireducens TaxID=2816476 RepID=UPI001A8C207E|nr:tRNA uridine-5-carboxymethylaminomethyl(34) synthesis GTPase MnmE [Paradesulfitobacterium ferrireducens]